MLTKWEVTVPVLPGAGPRAAYVYVPDSSREDPERRYPVLYMFDGHNVFYDADATYGKSWGMLEYLERTETQLIVAAVACNQSPDNSRLREYSPYSSDLPGFGRVDAHGKETMDWFVETFKPTVDARFPTKPDRSHTFIAGSSLGGLMSIYALFRYRQFFSRAAALSPAFAFGEKRVEQMLVRGAIRKDAVLYMDIGEKEMQGREAVKERFISSTAALMRREIRVVSRIVPDGEHNEASWERSIPIFVPVLLEGLE